MKVISKHNFDEATLRTIRAAHGRGGVASRKECLTFIDRAVRDALAKAPDPRPTRKRAPKPAPEPPTLLTEDQERAQAIERRERIRKLFRVSPEGALT